MKEPIPSIDWIITERCNYKCSYCFQRKYDEKGINEGHCSDKVINAVIKLLPSLPGSWLIKLTGGEPLIHPRFFEIAEKIIAAGHKLCINTNFSLPLSNYQRLANICGDKLDYLGASLHLDQVDDLNGFIKKAGEFNAIKNPAARFFVSSVLKEDNLEGLKAIERELKDRGVDFKFNIFKKQEKQTDRYIDYDDETKKYIFHKGYAVVEKTSKNIFGTFCKTGVLFFLVYVNGNVSRCYNLQPYYYLGNIAEGTFKRLKEAKPCFVQRCNCSVPADRNTILLPRMFKAVYGI